MEKIIGLINAPFTPFYEDGEVNYEPIEAYAKLLVKNGLKGVFINGSSGEGYMLTDEERMKLAERWMEVAPDGFKVIVHVGSCCVKSSRMLAEHAQKIGAWGIGAMAPPFPKIGRIEELVKYCEEIAAGAPQVGQPKGASPDLASSTLESSCVMSSPRLRKYLRRTFSRRPAITAIMSSSASSPKTSFVATS